MATKNPQVLLLAGSPSDLPVIEETEKLLTELDIIYERHIASAHRTPEKVARLAHDAAGRGVQVIIAAAGLAAHLAGAIAAQTTLPVIGIPMAGGSLGGLDALLSTVQMPTGLPVATMAIGTHGAKNAALFAAQILALRDATIADKLIQHRRAMAEAVEEADAKGKG